MKNSSFYKIFIICTIFWIMPGAIVVKASSISSIGAEFTDALFVPNSTPLTIKDNTGYNASNYAQNVESTDWVKSKVVLEFKPEALLAANAGNDLRCDVVVRITKQKDNITAADASFDVTLSAKYDHNLGVRFDGENAYLFNDIKYQFTIQIISISYYIDNILQTGNPAPFFTGLFKLRGEMLISWVLKMTANSSTAITTTGISGGLKTCTSTWTAVTGAVEYDVEWTFYDNLSYIYEQYTQNVLFASFESLYRNNASRTTVSTNTVTLKIVYPLGGIILFRVRPVRYLSNGERETGKWSSDNYTNLTLPQYMTTTGHKNGVALSSTNALENNINWQASIAFAEEGKLFYNVSYFDGLLYERQNMSLSNTINRTIVGETIYDYHGRPGISVLPAPTEQSFLRFQNLTNRAVSLNSFAYDYTNFDTYNTASCNNAPDPMSDLYGSSKYFSPNSVATTGSAVSALSKSYIPDALDYPFAETEYTPDMTGRVKRQGGVGPTFQIGSKYASYYYGKASQFELDRLFGIQVGDDSHYSKNMVQDPNGQYSVAYIDAHGRTIATALAGPSPANVTPLAGSDVVSNIKVNLINNVLQEHSLVSNYSLVVTNTGNHVYKYDLQPFNVNLENDPTTAGCTPIAPQCYECEYDVAIKVSDLCGNIILDQILYSYNGINAVNLTCESILDKIDWNTTLNNVPAGEYHVTKILTVSEVAANKYADLFIQNQDCISLEELQDQFAQTVDPTDCQQDCSSCTEGLSSLATFISAYNSAATDLGISPTPTDAELQVLFEEELANCNGICTGPSRCDILYQQILQDVSKGGQYGLYEFDETTADYSANDPNSVFHVDNTGYDFQHLPPGVVYTDASGNPDHILINGAVYTPQELSLEDFLHYWKPSWAEALIQIHPEYCYLSFCDDNEACLDFEQLMLETETYAEANMLGLLDPAMDEFNDCYPGFTGIMNSYLSDLAVNCSTTNVSVWDMISAIILCNGIYPCDGDINDMCEDELNLAWIMYRAVYLGKKYKLMADQSMQLANCPNPQIPADKIKRFLIPDIDFSFANSPYSLISDFEAGYDDATAGLEEHCLNTCTATADRWISILTSANCLSGVTDMVAFRQHLIDVCVNGCDAEHPNGSITAPIPTSDGYDSFYDVYSNFCDLNCSSYNIDNPGTYAKPQYIGPRIIQGDIDDCICTKLTELHSCFIGSNPPDISFTAFANYVRSFSDVQTPTEDLQTIYDKCIANTCKVVSKAISIPPILECDKCATYADFSANLAVFMTSTANGGCGFTNYNTIKNTPGRAKLCAHFLNQQLGLNLEFDDYDLFRTTYLSASTNASLKACMRLCPKTYNNFTEPDCNTQMLEEAMDQGTMAYNLQLEQLRQAFLNTYFSQCLNVTDQFTVDIPFNEYHYTLYYYDQAGNLTHTVPPNGVAILTPSQTNLIVAYHEAGMTGTPPAITEPAHSMITRYVYNSLNQVKEKNSPDGGVEKFWYDQLGRVVFSQSARQAKVGVDRFSYSRYDFKSRVIEVGEIVKTTPPTNAASGGFLSQSEINTFLNSTNTRYQVARTYYEFTPFTTPFGVQQNLRNRVTAATYQEVFNVNGTQNDYDYATHYSYDVTGNVKTVVQDIKELDAYGALGKNRYKRIDYKYDLVSGKVNQVTYQQGSFDQFLYVYQYDADNRLTRTLAGPNELLLKEEEIVSYYDYGPKFRTQLSANRVQGLDYAYTLQGWLKGVNGTGLDPSKDIGRDGNIVSGNSNDKVGRDAYAFTLNYFNGDYTGTNPTIANFATNLSGTGTAPFNAKSKDLFNGNIRFISMQLKQFDNAPIAYAYQYDQLNRLKEMNFFNTSISNTDYSLNILTNPSGDYQERYDYDGNGNILNLVRRGYLSTANGQLQPMDSLTYIYNTTIKNQLKRIRDGIADANYTLDLDTQSSASNYTYDESGNLISDAKEGIANIVWSPYGKLKSFQRTAGTVVTNIAYGYDAMQNRIVKNIVNASTGVSEKTYYIRDAQGNILSIYELKNGELRWSEQELYGSGRVGTYETNSVAYPVPVDPNSPTGNGLSILLPSGARRYELSNHLGNVLCVLSDVKRPVLEGSTTFFETDRLSTNDYYPFGMLMPGRKSSLDVYRFGFNGKENDNEAKGEGNQQDYGMRIYDPRVARFLSVDPLAGKYPFYTPYQFAGNMPIKFIDLDGLEPATTEEADKMTVYADRIVRNNFDSRDNRKYIQEQLTNDISDFACSENGNKFFIDENGGFEPGSYDYFTDLVQEVYRDHYQASIVNANYYDKWKSKVIEAPSNAETVKMMDARRKNTREVLFVINLAFDAGIELFGGALLSGTGSYYTSYGRSWSMNAAKGGNIALGVRESLGSFAKKVGGSTWETWGTKNFKTQFLKTINDPANKIHFNLDGVGDVWKAVSDGAKGLGISKHVTSWELSQIYSNPSALKRTTFYLNGKVVPNPF